MRWLRRRRARRLAKEARHREILREHRKRYQADPEYRLRTDVNVWLDGF